jgi:AAA domain
MVAQIPDGRAPVILLRESDFDTSPELTPEDVEWFASWYSDKPTAPSPFSEMRFDDPLAERLAGMLLDSAGLDSIPEPEPLIQGVLFRDSLAGPPGHAKTLVALDMAGSVSTGRKWQDNRTSRAGVLYMIAEGARGIRSRVRAWESAAGRASNVTYLPVAVQSANRRQWDALCALAAELRPGLVVLDTQARVTVGLEENSAKDMGEFVDRLERLRAVTGACVLTLHHTPRNGNNLRGSGAMEGAATTIIKVSKSGDIVTLTNDPDEGGKQKDAPPFDTVTLRLIERDDSVMLGLTDRPLETDCHSPAVRKLLSDWWDVFEGEEISPARLVEAVNCSRATFDRAARRLVKQGLVVKSGKGTRIQYSLTRDPSS